MSKTKIRKFAAPPRHAAPRHSALNAGRVTAVSATIGLVMAGTAIPAAAAQPAGNCSAPTAVGAVTCTYSDPAVGHYVLRIPAGVTDVHVTALGAGGGAGGVLRQDLAPAPGGAGGMTAAAFPVSPGDVLHVLVGGHGENANGTEPGAAGRNGGAAGGTGAPAAGGGGGASSVKLNGTEHHARILVAGGGGGGGGTLSPTAGPVSGGDGGGERGENGGGGYFGPGGLGAQGPIGGAGLDTVIGTDGHDGLDENNGGAGGEGGYATSDRIKHSGTWPGGPVGAGGGGGGYAGGGGGAAGPQAGGGGGGGSGYVAASRLAGIDSVRSLTGGGSKNDGLVVITYQLPTKRAGGSQVSTPPAVAPSLAADAARKP